MGSYTYSDIVDDALDIYDSLFIRSEYSLQDTFCSWLNDFHLDEKSDGMELNILMYVGFTCLLIIKQQDISFLLKDLRKILDDSGLGLRIKIYLDNDNDYLLFGKDWQILLSRLADYRE